jgi:uncharacterized coiled-coil protein SlyX
MNLSKLESKIQECEQAIQNGLNAITTRKREIDQLTEQVNVTRGKLGTYIEFFKEEKARIAAEENRAKANAVVAQEIANEALEINDGEPGVITPGEDE